LQIVTTADGAVENFWDADLRAPILFFFGNEGEGLPPEILAQGRAVKIPMRGVVDSLNLATAASVILFESERQRLETRD
jgi:tRNA G18 (ribose-2'-O)-methylase SpoU